ncbi:MAG: hypothetical protein IT291_05035 [Deltaproteobacteria bacterium]|nr:hypothetical protein [Deltaproteobacteria bacterium]
MKDSILRQLEGLPYFSSADLRAILVPDKTAQVFLYRMAKRGEILKLRRSVYATRAFISSVRELGEIVAYQEFLANVLVSPSYISCEYVLAKHELLTEAVTTITSLTPKRPVLISNALGYFQYRNIANNILGKFDTINKGRFTVKCASRIQALFDYLYMKKKDLKNISPSIVNELRINAHLLSKRDFAELKELTARSSSRKLMKIVKLLEAMYVS